MASRATDQVRRDEWNAHERSHTPAGRWVKHTRWALLKAPDRQSLDQLGTLGEVYTRNRRLYRAFLLYHQLRLLYALDDPALAPVHLDTWLAWAARSKLAPFVKAARTLRHHRSGVLAAIRPGLSNGRLEGLNSRVRLISHPSFGFHSAAPLIAPVPRRHHDRPAAAMTATQTLEAPQVQRSRSRMVRRSAFHPLP